MQNAANLGLNPESHSVCLPGNFELYPHSKEQIDTLVQVLASWCKRFNVLVENIIGHYQVATIKNNKKYATACPGKYLIQLLPEIRERVKKYL